VDSESCVDVSWILLCQFKRLLRLCEIRTGDEEFLTSCSAGSRYHGGEVGWVALLLVVESGIDWVGEIDAYLIYVVGFGLGFGVLLAVWESRG